ncbi:uncharacterized protein C7orf57 homolog [Megalops cyprinoides]|uniref:uncharacterized protein C7orf57 homolog n=1 Tax=Megalops cyprinoides TaxID=118141 RepID=UPI001864F9E9|nr:uncharacterized protein C7orf57 homolog [Megalops cyprinoides]
MSTEADHRRRKPGSITNNTTNVNREGPTSQIPGLSNSADAAPLERTRGRRVGIFETDSDYVKLAKQGGQKGLLWHEETNVETKPNAQYKPPDWFSLTESQEKCPTKRTTPDNMTSEEQESPSKGSAVWPNAPFGSDNKSTWEREADSLTSGKEKKTKANHVANQMQKMSLSSGNQEASKYKRTSYEKKPAPVSMSKLLSFGYAEDEKKSPDDDESSVTSEPASSICPEDELE